MVDDDQLDLVRGDERLEVLDLAGAEQRRRARRGDRDEHAVDDVQVDRLGEALGLL